jgi:hypothetical protein
VRRNKGSIEPADDYTFLCEIGNDNNYFGTDSLPHDGIISVDKTAEYRA